MWEKELRLAQELAVQAGAVILEIYNSTADLQIEYKADTSPLTRADRASNALIVPALKQAFPGHAVLSEEEKDDLTRLDNDLCFLVDPLDGTKEFIKRNGQFTVNIALAFRQRVVMGVVYIPVRRELYFATQGSGAFWRMANGREVAIHVAPTIGTANLRMVGSLSHISAEQDALIQKHHIQHFVQVGSAIKGCLIAKGDADIYYRYGPTMEWDTAAMQCIVEEAGGVLRQMDGSEMLYNRRNSVNDKGFYVLNRPENHLTL